MPEAAVHVAKETLLITGFVFVMMLVIEYVNVLTEGEWQARLSCRRWGQYVLAAALGATPGCLGAFAVVAMYAHRVMTVGAVVAAAIATAGDASFVMLARMPKTALGLTAFLFVLGLAVGVLVDLVGGRRCAGDLACCEGLAFHPEKREEVFARGKILTQWKECTAARGVLALALTLFIVAVVTGQIGTHGLLHGHGEEHAEEPGVEAEAEGHGEHVHEGPPAKVEARGEEVVPSDWGWVRITIVAVSAVALFIVSTVSDHFLEEHLWRHVAREHAPRVFLWTLGALVAARLIAGSAAGAAMAGSDWGPWLMLIVAGLLGLIPDHGPQMVFVFLYLEGTVPLGVLVASSVVQDGHGMLPMLAHSRRVFLVVKAVNLAAGLAAGAAALAAGL
jgi:hypothetical protein